MDRTKQLDSKAQQILSQIGELGVFRSGTLNERRTRCGKSNCHCAQDDDPGHIGWQLVRSVNGKPVCRGIPKSELEQTRQQLAEHQRFMELVKQFIEINESLCDQQLKQRSAQKKTLHRTLAKRLPTTPP